MCKNHLKIDPLVFKSIHNYSFCQPMYVRTYVHALIFRLRVYAYAFRNIIILVTFLFILQLCTYVHMYL